MGDGDPVRVFEPDSVLWKVCRERAILLHGPAAAVMQVAHPRIGLGVFQHSGFESEPTGRLHRTLDAVYTIAFGTREDASRVEQGVRAIHNRVRGDAAAHNVPGNVLYSAFERDLLMWVLATMIMSAIDGYERSIAKLTRDEKQEFYTQMRVLGTYFGLEREHGPTTWDQFVKYWDDQLRDSMLGEHEISRRVARAVASPTRPLWLAIASRPIRFIFSEIVPEPVRTRLGFRPTLLSRLSLRVTTWALWGFVRVAPARIRFVPHYNQAAREITSLSNFARCMNLSVRTR